MLRSTLDAPAGTAPRAVGISMMLGLLDVRIKKERALLGNLGISQPMLAGLFALSAVVGELVLSLALGLA